MDDDDNDIERANALLRRVFGTDPEAVTEAVLNTIINAPGDAVAEVAGHGERDIEVWLNTNLTEKEKDDVEVLYRIREVGVYGDPALAGTDEGSDLEGKTYLHLALRE